MLKEKFGLPSVKVTVETVVRTKQMHDLHFFNISSHRYAIFARKNIIKECDYVFPKKVESDYRFQNR